MKRRFNYTGRKKIPRDRISINLNKEGRLIKSFEAKINLENGNFPSDAKFYIEAYHKTEIRRYYFGTAENIIHPPDKSLSNLAYIENLKFRILVVDESSEHGRILAHADRIRPISDKGEKPILPVEFRDLGRQIWRLEFSGDEDAPILAINKNIPNIQHIAKTNPQFIMFVYPSVLREVLKHMIFVEGVDSPSDPSTDWHKDWLEFSRKILPSDFPEVLDKENDDFESERDNVLGWINKIVEEFCDNRSEWAEYITQLGEE